ncbi:putative ATPase YjoB [Vanrija pseudolonga]|uniref:Purtative ATPase YjoB n=1 Tax=Vanrija pseudolonga TaxID=143232 RepID=A0AAF0YAI7_9TREE|nr:purtative ATPase YjoB [Vanrija pseudolonga]
MRLQHVLGAFIAASAATAFKQVPFDLGDPFGPRSVHDTFVDHFSSSRAGTDTVLQTAVEALYANSTVTTTIDPGFNILRYAQVAEEPILVREDKSIQSLKKTFFFQPSKRHQGPYAARREELPHFTKVNDDDGFVVEQVVLAGYDVAWRNTEFKLIVATWPEGFYQAVQWHIVSDDKQANNQLLAAVSKVARTFEDVIWVFDQGWWQPDRNLWLSVQKASWSDVILDEEFKHGLQHDYRSFLKSRDTYKRLGVPWKRGLIFLGPPGNGKTVSLKAIMKELDIPALYVKSFRSYMGDEGGIKDIFSRAREEAPCLLVFEDLDSLITDENRAFFLNEVDGIDDNDGLLLIGTTNHFDRLDLALSNRPSRFDRKYNFPNPTRDERRQYAVYWQDKVSDVEGIDFPDDLLDEFADKTDKFSFAYMKEAFVSALLQIAADESKHPPEFRPTLLKEVQHLRDELDRGDGDGAKAAEAGGSGRGSGGGGDGMLEGSGFFSRMRQAALNPPAHRMAYSYPWLDSSEIYG